MEKLQRFSVSSVESLTIGVPPIFLFLCLNFCSTKEHQRVDWQGIHEKICPLLAPLRTPPPIIGSEEERARRQYTLQMSQRALIDLTKNEASKYLVLGQHELAVLIFVSFW